MRKIIFIFMVFSLVSFSNSEFPGIRLLVNFNQCDKNDRDIGSPIVLETSANACPKANNRLAKIAPSGFHFPKIIAAIAIYPRPADMLFEKAGSRTAVR